mmetsp:Transcript_4619/g.15315  ORF Transcript_4619/g.15315 Transcript_4619/m.15315 type:complete len:244 (+) Transcript_4619:266-997(+)
MDASSLRSWAGCPRGMSSSPRTSSRASCTTTRGASSPASARSRCCPPRRCFSRAWKGPRSASGWPTARAAPTSRTPRWSSTCSRTTWPRCATPATIASPPRSTRSTPTARPTASRASAPRTGATWRSCPTRSAASSTGSGRGCPATGTRSRPRPGSSSSRTPTSLPRASEGCRQGLGGARGLQGAACRRRARAQSHACIVLSHTRGRGHAAAPGLICRGMQTSIRSYHAGTCSRARSLTATSI